MPMLTPGMGLRRASVTVPETFCWEKACNENNEKMNMMDLAAIW
jgi:hypothetical protein